MTKFNSELIKLKMQANLANLETNLKNLQNKIEKTFNWLELNKMYLIKKKLDLKIKRLKNRLAEPLVQRTIKLKMKDFKFKYWYQQYPHCKIDGSLIVIGRNALKSESLKKKILPNTYYYHISNRTGGSIILFTKTFTSELHAMCKSFALVYSSYWKTPTQYAQYVTWTTGQFILLKNKSAKGQFYLKKAHSELTNSPALTLYYCSQYNIITYTPTDIQIGQFYKSKENLHKQIYEKLSKLNINMINKTILSLWIPEKGSLK